MRLCRPYQLGRVWVVIVGTDSTILVDPTLLSTAHHINSGQLKHTVISKLCLLFFRTLKSFNKNANSTPIYISTRAKVLIILLHIHNKDTLLNNQKAIKMRFIRGMGVHIQSLVFNQLRL